MNNHSLGNLRSKLAPTDPAHQIAKMAYVTKAELQQLLRRRLNLLEEADQLVRLCQVEISSSICKKLLVVRLHAYATVLSLEDLSPLRPDPSRIVLF